MLSNNNIVENPVLDEAETLVFDKVKDEIYTSLGTLIRSQLFEQEDKLEAVATVLMLVVGKIDALTQGNFLPIFKDYIQLCENTFNAYFKVDNTH